MKPKKEFMERAIQEALKAKKSGDYAIGAVIVKGDKVICAVKNQAKTNQNPTHHAETLAISEAARILKNRHLEGCTLYTTHEPCPMCTSAAIWAKINTIVFGAAMDDMKRHHLKNANKEWAWRTIDIPAAKIAEKGNPKPDIVSGFMREECKKLFHS